MKRTVLIVIVLSFISMIAFAENIDTVIPDDSLWGISLKEFVAVTDMTVSECNVGKKKALKVSNINIASYDMDVYYVFDERMHSSIGQEYRGLSKIAYILNNNDKLSASYRTECYNALVENMIAQIGKPDTADNSVSTWIKDVYKIQIGAGKFKNYTGSDNSSVGIIITSVKTPASQSMTTSVPVYDNRLTYDQVKDIIFDTTFKGDRVFKYPKTTELNPDRLFRTKGAILVTVPAIENGKFVTGSTLYVVDNLKIYTEATIWEIESEQQKNTFELIGDALNRYIDYEDGGKLSFWMGDADGTMILMEYSPLIDKYSDKDLFKAQYYEEFDSFDAFKEKVKGCFTDVKISGNSNKTQSITTTPAPTKKPKPIMPDEALTCGISHIIEYAKACYHAMFRVEGKVTAVYCKKAGSNSYYFTAISYR